jgi:competence ComEA-like helix-hairpin-helix protein
MNSSLEPIKNWFGFTRRERRSTFIMLLLVAMIIGVRYTIPERKIDIEDITGTFPSVEYYSEISVADSGSAVKPLRTYSTTGRKKFFYPAIKKPGLQKAKIDINKSDSSTLVGLPGIGPVLSSRIIKYRRLLGGFARIDQLKEVYGLPEETFESIKGRVFADSTVVTRIIINSAGYKELLHFPYFTKYEITAILKYREIKGRITGINDLTDNKLITEEKASKISPYIKFDD